MPMTQLRKKNDYSPGAQEIEGGDYLAQCWQENRDGLRARFLELHGLAEAQVSAIPADMSRRRYYRVILADGATRILMDAPPEYLEKPAGFAQIAVHLQKLGLRVPEILAADLVNGFLLLEDFGQNSFRAVLERGADPEAVYSGAIDVLVALHRHMDAVQINVPLYQDSGLFTLLREVAIFTQWYLPAVRGQAFDPDLNQSWRNVWRGVIESLPVPPRALVLRDFHVDNLMVVPPVEGRDVTLSSCGLLDFQDALIGAPAYDVASLLQDARRDVSPELAQAMLARYRAGMGDAHDVASFDIWYDVLAAQRHAKVLGLFVRFCLKGGSDRTLCHIPRLVRMMTTCLQAPVLAPVADWLAEHAPDWQNPLPVLATGSMQHLDVAG